MTDQIHSEDPAATQPVGTCDYGASPSHAAAQLIEGTRSRDRHLVIAWLDHAVDALSRRLS
jgi:hypothetical protein